jgi:hypothetical protein
LSTAHNCQRRGIPTVCKVVIQTVIRIKIRRPIPLIVAGQHISRSQTAVGIGYIVIERVSGSPYSDVVVDTTDGKFSRPLSQLCFATRGLAKNEQSTPLGIQTKRVLEIAYS